MTKKELQALRVLIDRARREQLLLPMGNEEHWHGQESGYGWRGCRCSRCRAAATSARNVRRKAQLERDPDTMREKDRQRQKRYRDSLTPAQRKERNRKESERYHSDPEFREKRRAQKYQANLKWRTSVAARDS